MFKNGADHLKPQARLVNRSTGGYPFYNGISDVDSDPRQVGNFTFSSGDGETQAYGSPNTGYFGTGSLGLTGAE